MARNASVAALLCVGHEVVVVRHGGDHLVRQAMTLGQRAFACVASASVHQQRTTDLGVRHDDQRAAILVVRRGIECHRRDLIEIVVHNQRAAMAQVWELGSELASHLRSCIELFERRPRSWRVMLLQEHRRRIADKVLLKDPMSLARCGNQGMRRLRLDQL